MNETSIVTMPAPSPEHRQILGLRWRALMPSRTVTRAIGAQLPVHLAVSDVERDDTAGAALQQHVGEAAGGRADVDGQPPGTSMAKRVEREARA